MVSVVRSYVYDDGDESQSLDTFQREPLVVQFRSTTTSEYMKKHFMRLEQLHFSMSTTFIYVFPARHLTSR